MAEIRHTYEDQWGEVIDRPALDLVELRWHDATAGMSAGQFQDWLAVFAGQLEQLHRSRVLVDATRFTMDHAKMNDEWRDAHIVPRYNGAGVRRFAFLYPDGVPLIGQPPGPMGPATFPTGYFGRRQAALDWLCG
jgi:hypothetical protein